MLTSIVVVAPSAAWWPDFAIPVRGPEVRSFFVKTITGLDPVPADITTKAYGEIDGEFHVNSHVGKRNILFTVALNPALGAASVATERAKFFVSLPIKFFATLRLEFDDRAPVSIQGYVESVESDRFTAEPEVQVSIICPKPNFREVDDRVVSGVTGPEEPEDIPVTYSGSAGGGWIMDINATEETYNGRVYVDRKIGPDGDYEEMGFFSLYIPMGGLFRINTHPGQKTVVTLDYPDDDNPSLVLSRMRDMTVWLPLYAANYFFRVRTPESAFGLDWTLRYFDQFTGV